MEKVVDIAAVIVALLVVPSVVWAIRTEKMDVSAALASFVAVFVTIMAVVFVSAASNLATGQPTTQIVMLVFYVAIAILVRVASASKPAA